MGYLLRLVPPHDCPTPGKLQVNGSVWQCDECKKYWGYQRGWLNISERQAKKALKKGRFFYHYPLMVL